MLGPVPRRVDHPQEDGSNLDLVTVVQRVMGVVGIRINVDRDGDAVLEGEAAMACEMVGVGVRLDRADDPDVATGCLCDHGLDRVRRIDDHGDARFFVPDEVTRTTQVVVQELMEDHRSDGSTLSR